MSKRSIQSANPKIPLIIDSTLAILRDHGEQGLAMRKVAAQSGMSLGNLQYYFKNKDELLAGVIREYFERCNGDFSEKLLEQKPEGKQETIRFLVEYGMDYADSEIGKVFRELWGIAARNKNVKKHLYEYYRESLAEIMELLAPYAGTGDGVPRAASLLVSFHEGYGMVSSALPSNRQEMTEFLVHIVNSVLAESFPPSWD